MGLPFISALKMFMSFLYIASILNNTINAITLNCIMAFIWVSRIDMLLVMTIVGMKITRMKVVRIVISLLSCNEER